MAQINPYLTFNGNCEDAFNFYKSVFGTEFEFIGRFKDMPPSDHKISETAGNLIMHVSLPIGGGTSLFGSDSSEEFGHVTKTGDNFSISINASSEDEAKKLFEKLSQGGKITMPLEKTFWGALFGMFTDKFDINWMVNYDYKQN